jgi:hypothetical protein
MDDFALTSRVLRLRILPIDALPSKQTTSIADTDAGAATTFSFAPKRIDQRTASVRLERLTIAENHTDFPCRLCTAPPDYFNILVQ